MSVGKIKIRQVRSTIGQLPVHRQTIRGLGLGKINRQRILQDTPQVRGMINRVRHLVEIVE